MHARKPIYTLTAAILATFATTAMAAPDGLYSASELMDADVYQADSQKQVGEVEDIILDSSLAVRSLVIETDEVLGLGGESYVVRVGDLRIATITQGNSDDPEYRVTLDATINQIKAYPAYSDSWWDNVQANAGAVWTQTREAAEGAWSQIKETTTDLVDGDQGPAE